MEYIKNIAASSEHQKNMLLLTGVIALVAADAIPTPADAWVMWRERINRNKFNDGELSVKKYWTKEVANYYLPNILWWSAVGLLTFSIKGTAKQRLTFMGSLIGVGVVVGVIARNIKKDTEMVEQKKTEQNGNKNS